jgi:hypothetical protein
MTCKTCKYWDQRYEPAICRRNPPQVQFKFEGGWRNRVEDSDYLQQLVPLEFWPETEADDWCGEHQPKEIPKGEAK